MDHLNDNSNTKIDLQNHNRTRKEIELVHMLEYSKLMAA
jgi:hypothetical protein